jgi:pSer/pThr/pTyr-binding forkhead associated (FHA) protein
VTIGVFQKRQGIDPVVGWLVCTRGVNRGRDYRLHSGVNKIGRAPNMDVCIEGDETITRDIHCQIAYSSRNKGFTILPGTGARNLVYLNGEDVFSAMALQPSDLIEIGEGTFSFQPFCSDSFDWSDANESGDALGAS